MNYLNSIITEKITIMKCLRTMQNSLNLIFHIIHVEFKYISNLCDQIGIHFIDYREKKKKNHF